MKKLVLIDTYPLDHTGKNIVWENMANHYRRLYSAKPRVDTNLKKTQQSSLIRQVRYSPPKKPKSKQELKAKEENKIKVNRGVQTQTLNGYKPLDKKSVRFLRDITDEALKRGAYTDFTLERIFIKHNKKNKYNLDKDLRDKELDRLRKELGMPTKNEEISDKVDKGCITDFEAVEALNALTLNPKVKHNILDSLGIASVGETVPISEQIEKEDVESIEVKEKSYVSVRPKDAVLPESSESEEEVSYEESESEFVKSDGQKQVENSLERVKTVLDVIDEEKITSYKSDYEETVSSVSSEEEFKVKKFSVTAEVLNPNSRSENTSEESSKKTSLEKSVTHEELEEEKEQIEKPEKDSESVEDVSDDETSSNLSSIHTEVE